MNCASPSSDSEGVEAGREYVEAYVEYGNGCQQQAPASESHEQPQVGCLPVIIPLKIALAHPTPAFTSIAPNGQFIRHAPHSMQLSGLRTTALLFSIAITACGQTLRHIPQPAQRSLLIFNDAVFFVQGIDPPQFAKNEIMISTSPPTADIPIGRA